MGESPLSGRSSMPWSGRASTTPPAEKQATLFWTLHREQIARIAKTHVSLVKAFSDLCE
jgi:hypothetical protein